MEKLGSSIVLAADDPAALAALYAGLLRVQATPGLSPSHWRVPWPAGGRLALCLQRSSEGTDATALLTAWLEVAAGLGAELAEPPRQERFGVEAWLRDTEGNRLLLLVS